MFGYDLSTTITAPVMDMLDKLGGYAPTAITALLILGLGWVAAKFIRVLIEDLLGAIHFETVAKRCGITGVLKEGKVKMTPTKVVGALAYYVSMITVLLLVLNVLGVAGGFGLIDGFIGYIPSVVTALFVMVLGMFMARFVSIIVRVAANNTDLPRPEILESISHWAIVIFTLTITLKELGFTALFEGQTATILFAGIVLAAAIAFGLGGKDAAEKYLKVLHK